MSRKSKIKQLKSVSPYCVILSTFPRRKDALCVAEGLIEKRLAACCNLLPNLDSFFRWEGKKEHAREWLLLIKTESRCLEGVWGYLSAHHPYDVPECVALPICAGSDAYLSWIKESCR